MMKAAVGTHHPEKLTQAVLQLEDGSVYEGKET
jgi:hypothetical protein